MTTRKQVWDEVANIKNTKDRLLRAAQVIAQPEEVGSSEWMDVLREDVVRTIKEIHKIHANGQEALGTKEVAYILESLLTRLRAEVESTSIDGDQVRR